MSDEIVVKQEPRELHPEGQFAALCVDLVALGMRVNDFQGHESASEACAFIFVTGEKTTKGFPFHLQQELNISTGAKSKLMKFLRQWRGKDFTPEEMGAGFTLSAYVGKPALISVVRKLSKAGNPRVEIDTIMPLPKGMAVTPVSDYKRPDFWAKKKAEYAAGYAKFLGKTMGGDDEPIPDGEEAPF